MFHLTKRSFSSIIFNSFGIPSNVLKVIPSTTSVINNNDLKSNDVIVNIKSCPISYEDIRSINGLSFLRSNVGIAGSIGVGNITNVGKNVTFPVGSQVLVASQSGTWTNNVQVSSSSVFDLSNINSDIASLVPDIASAWYILNKYIQLQPKSTIIRTNHGTTAFNAAFDYIASTKGSTVIVAKQSDLTDPQFYKNIEAKGGVSLVLSHYAGRNNRLLFKYLTSNGVAVTYNGIIPSIEECSGIEFSTVKQIFNNHQLKGFNFNSVLYNDNESGKEAINAAVSLIKNNTELFHKIPVQNYSEEKVVQAIENINSSSGETAVLHIH